MKLPSLHYEQLYWEQDIARVAGVDEVGMGALAGPVVAGAVVFKNDLKDTEHFPVIRDSKTLSAAQREQAAGWIKANAWAWAVAEASVEEIEKYNILQAARLAMRRAITQLSVSPEILLIDGRPPAHAATDHERKDFLMPSEYLIKGDQKSFSIAAASIIAKVHRDGLMIAFDRQYPAYGLASHKGYGAASHMAALKAQGASPIHRKTYAPVAACLPAGRRR